MLYSWQDNILNLIRTSPCCDRSRTNSRRGDICRLWPGSSDPLCKPCDKVRVRSSGASFPGLSQELGNEVTLHNEASGEAVLFFFFLLRITYFHFQGNGDSFKSQSVYKGILSARCDVFTCMMIMLLPVSSVCSIFYWRICNNSSEGTGTHECKGLSPKTLLPQ